MRHPIHFLENDKQLGLLAENTPCGLNVWTQNFKYSGIPNLITCKKCNASLIKPDASKVNVSATKDAKRKKKPTMK